MGFITPCWDRIFSGWGWGLLQWAHVFPHMCPRFNLATCVLGCIPNSEVCNICTGYQTYELETPTSTLGCLIFYFLPKWNHRTLLWFPLSMHVVIRDCVGLKSRYLLYFEFFIFETIYPSSGLTKQENLSVWEWSLQPKIILRVSLNPSSVLLAKVISCSVGETF